MAGADVFSRQSDGTTIAAHYARHGLKLTCANTERIQGWAEILQRLGDPATGTSRVTLGGGINSFGTTIGPIVVAVALFGTTAAITDEKIAALSLGKVITLYICVGALFIAAAALFFFSKKVPAGSSQAGTGSYTQ